jgi:ATP-dependent Clp protease ATP-binding subunit ClpC
MFERFTDAARRVVVLAQEEARLASHNYVGTEHLLLGLIREEDGLAAQVLASIGVELDQARRRVGELVAAGERPEVGEQAQADRLLFSPGAKKALQLSLRESLQLGRSKVGTEDLLLGVIREDAGVGAQVLAEYEVSPSDVRLAVISLTRKARVGLTRSALTSEVERLKAVLREHGIDPGEPEVEPGQPGDADGL